MSSLSLSKKLDEVDETGGVQIILSLDEKIRCLEEIISRLKKIIYVWEKSQEPNSTYNYRVYCGGVAMYVSSSNILFNGELVNVVVNLTSILQNNQLNKAGIKKLVFDSVNFVEYILKKYKGEDTEKEGDVNAVD